MSDTAFRPTESPSPNQGPDVKSKDQSVGTLLGRVSSDTAQLFRKELELAKIEIKEEVANVTKGAGMLGATAFCGYMAIVMGSFAAAWGIARVLPAGWAFLCIMVLYVFLAGILFLVGQRKLKKVGAPQQTIETLKEDAQWARELKN